MALIWIAEVGYKKFYTFFVKIVYNVEKLIQKLNIKIKPNGWLPIVQVGYEKIF